VPDCINKRDYKLLPEGPGLTGCGKTQRHCQSMIPGGDLLSSRGQRPRKTYPQLGPTLQRVAYARQHTKIVPPGQGLCDPFRVGSRTSHIPGALPPAINLCPCRARNPTSFSAAYLAAPPLDRGLNGPLGPEAVFLQGLNRLRKNDPPRTTTPALGHLMVQAA
jgi:hypothetical protein